MLNLFKNWVEMLGVIGHTPGEQEYGHLKVK